jgi:hypothetical protein
VSGIDLSHLFFFVFSGLGDVQCFLCVKERFCMGKTLVSTHFFIEVIVIFMQRVRDYDHFRCKRVRGGGGFYRVELHDYQGDNRPICEQQSVRQSCSRCTFIFLTSP